MDFKRIHPLYLIVRMSKAIPGEKRCSWVTYQVKIVTKY
jgi:hypothetical protein